MAQIPILILAAGSSSRMGGADKLLERLDGQNLLEDRVRAALATGQPVYVTLPDPQAAPARWQALQGLTITRVAVPDASQGMAASLARGIAALPETADGVLLMLADMPEITTQDLLTILAAHDGSSVLRGADSDGHPGHPVLFPARFLSRLSKLTGDKGARDLLKGFEDLRLIPLPASHAMTDLDTKADWAAWRRKPKPENS